MVLQIAETYLRSHYTDLFLIAILISWCWLETPVQVPASFSDTSVSAIAFSLSVGRLTVIPAT